MAKVISVKKVPKKDINERELYATLCYYYPQYTLRQAASMPARDLMLLVNVAKKIEAGKMYNLTQIAAAPHTQKGRGVKRLSDYFRKEMG